MRFIRLNSEQRGIKRQRFMRALKKLRREEKQRREAIAAVEMRNAQRNIKAKTP